MPANRHIPEKRFLGTFTPRSLSGRLRVEQFKSAADSTSANVPRGRTQRFSFRSASSRPGWSPRAMSFSRIFNRVTPSQRAALAWLPPAN